MKNIAKFLALGVFAASTTLAANATPITPGQTNITIASIAAGTQGTLVASTSGTATALDFSANYTESVYTGGVNSLCTNCLAFAVTVTNLTSTDVIQFITESLFGSFTTDVYSVAGTGAVPSSASRTPTGNGVSFNYAAGFGPTQGDATTDQLIIYTNATAFSNLGGLALQDDSNVTVGGYMPTGTPTITPEPSSLLMLGTGLASAAGMVFRKRRQVAA